MRYFKGLRLSRIHIIAAALVLVAVTAAITSFLTALTIANSPAQQQAPDDVPFPSIISYQGRLSDANGEPAPNDVYALAFAIYDSEIDGKLLWSEEQNLAVRGGLFQTFLGTRNPLEPAMFVESEIWLEITVGEEILKPRQQLAAVPYAFNSFSLQGKTPKDLTPDIVNLGRQVLSLSGSPDYENLASLSITTPGAGTLLVEATGTVTINSSGSYVDMGFSLDEMASPDWSYRAGTPSGEQVGPFSWPFAVSDVYDAASGQTYNFYLKGRQLGSPAATVIELGSFRATYYPP